MIIRPENCGETFKLEPLEDIFPIFSNQANEKCFWVAVQLTEKIKFQSFWWDLIWIVGKVIRYFFVRKKLPSAKNKYPSNICINWDISMNARSNRKIVYLDKHNSRDENLSTNCTPKYFSKFSLLDDADWYYTDTHTAIYHFLVEGKDKSMLFFTAIKKLNKI